MDAFQDAQVAQTVVDGKTVNLFPPIQVVSLGSALSTIPYMVYDPQTGALLTLLDVLSSYNIK